MAIKKSECAYKTLVKLNDEFVEKCIGDKYLKEEQILFLGEGHVYNDQKGEYVHVRGKSGITSGYAYLNELDLAFSIDKQINAIVIMNNIGLNKMLFVENFSDENIKKALSKAYSIDIENIQCLSVSGGERMIYGVKENYSSLKDQLGSVNPYYSEYPEKHFHYFHIITASFA